MMPVARPCPRCRKTDQTLQRAARAFPKPLRHPRFHLVCNDCGIILARSGGAITSAGWTILLALLALALTGVQAVWPTSLSGGPVATLLAILAGMALLARLALLSLRARRGRRASAEAGLNARKDTVKKSPGPAAPKDRQSTAGQPAKSAAQTKTAPAGAVDPSLP